MKSQTKPTWIFSSLLLILAVDAISFGLVLPLLPHLVGGEGAWIQTTHPALAVGFTLAIFPLLSMIGTPLLGYCSDKMGRKPILMLSLFGSALGLGLTSIAIVTQSLLGLIIGRGLTGLLGASQPLAQATVTDIAPPDRKAYLLGWVAVAMTVGMLAGPLMGGSLTRPGLPLGLALPFVVAATLALINALALWRFFPETYRPAANLTRIPWSQFIGVLVTPSLLPKLLAFTGLELAWSWCFQGIGVVVAPYAKWSTLQTAYVMSSLGICMSLGLCLLFPYWLKRASVRQISRFSLLAILLAWCLSFGMNKLWIGALAAVVLTIAVGIAYTAILTELSNALGRHQQGWLMGVAASLLALAWALSGFGLGYVTKMSLIPWLSIGLGLSVLTLLCWLAKFGWTLQALHLNQAD